MVMSPIAVQVRAVTTPRASDTNQAKANPGASRRSGIVKQNISCSSASIPWLTACCRFAGAAKKTQLTICVGCPTPGFFALSSF